MKNSSGANISGNNVTSPQSVQITSLVNGNNYLVLTPASLNNITEFTFQSSGIPSATKKLIISVNLTGNYTWNNANMAGIGGAQGPFIFWNFGGTATYNLTINTASQIVGTVFAPRHNLIKVGMGDIEGSLIAKTMSLGTGEIHYFPPAGGIPSCGSVVCNNVTSGGTIGSDQTISSGGDPAALTNITFPSGGSGALEYLWLKSTTIPCPAIGSPNWEAIPNSNSATYDPGPLTQSTCFMRCARRVGCTEYDGESNAVTITVSSGCTCPNNLITNSSFESGVTGWNKWGGTLYTGSYAAVCGANSGQFQVAGSDGGIYQEKTGIAPGTGINLSVYAGVHNSGYYAEEWLCSRRRRRFCWSRGKRLSAARGRHAD